VARAQANGATGTGDSEFAQNATTGPYLGGGVYSFPSVKQAQAFMTTTRTQLSCGTYSASPNGTTINYTLAPIAYSKVGDDTLAIRETSTAASAPGGLSGSADDIVVRIGNNAVLIAYGGLGGTDTTLEQQYVGKAITKLGAALALVKPTTTTTQKKKKK
jgi:hypothetical protein